MDLHQNYIGGAWVEPTEDLEEPLSPPWPRWPGAVLGMKLHPEVGEVEFIASRGRQLVLIGTQERVFAVSPNDREAFLLALQRQMELGSLTPLPARSRHAGFLAADLWNSRTARGLLVLGGLVLLPPRRRWLASCP